MNSFPEIEYRIASAPVDYPHAITEMEQRVAAIEAGQASELIWMLEHPALYTAGTSASDDELLDTRGFPIYETGRGGRTTYHGPGQRVVYVLSDLRQRGRDVHAHVHRLEECVIQTLRAFGVKGERREGRVGIWVEHQNREEKIAAIGVRVRHWITYHGLSLNVDPDMSHFGGIIPCGLHDYGVTSLRKLGVSATMAEVDTVFREVSGRVFSK